LCDACGKEAGLCPGCQRPPEEAELSRDVKIPGESGSEDDDDENDDDSEEGGNDYDDDDADDGHIETK
jgi:hypothetical protein